MSHDLSTSSILFMSTYMIELWDERFTRGYIYTYVGKGNLGPIMHVLNNPCLSFQLGVKGRNVSGWHCSMCVGIYMCVCGSTMIIGAWLMPSHHIMQCLPHIYMYLHTCWFHSSLPTSFPFPLPSRLHLWFNLSRSLFELRPLNQPTTTYATFLRTLMKHCSSGTWWKGIQP